MFKLSAAEDTQFLREVKAAQVYQAHPLARITLYAAVAFFGVAWFWARNAVLDEVTVGQGKVIPSSQVQVIQNLEGGILSELMVKEGQTVERDQVLLRIDDTKAASSYREGRARYLALTAMVARLTAEAYGGGPNFPEEVRREAPELIRIENSLYLSRQAALSVSIDSLRKSHALASQELQMTLPLIDKGAISEVEVLRLRRQVSELAGQMDEKRNRFRADAALELNKVKSELAGLAENNVASKDRVARTTVRSSMRGVVKKINVTTVGGVIQPGMDILEIVPLEDSLLVEAQIRPSDIAFLRPGQDTMVKVTAYDYSIYGGLPAVLEHISADTIVDEKKGESYYKIRVRTKRNALGSDAKPLPIIPGMTSSVEILTGHKSVLDYLLKPFLKARERALRER